MKIKTYDCLPKDEDLKFKLVLGPKSIWLKGRIAYSRVLPDKQSVLGIQFMNLSEEAYTSLQESLAVLEEWPKRRSMLSTGSRDDADGLKTGEE
jgi:hypothetical protein